MSTPAPAPAPAPHGLPPSEIEIDESLVRELLSAQHPDLAGLPLRLAATGWDNVTYRLGDRLAVRLPRIAAGVGLLRHEQRWLPVLAPDLPLPVPAPVRIGLPAVGGAGRGFPWPWSVVPWVPGRSGEHEGLAASEAAVFGGFLAAVHRPAPDGFPRNNYRGVPLDTCTDRMMERLERLAAGPADPGVPLEEVRTVWQRCLAAPADVPDVVIHGDLHPKNVVVSGGRLAAVIDWGDMTAGDPATDLGAAWMLFPPEVHPVIWRAYGGISDATAARATGWAVFFGVTLLDVGLAEDPPFAEIGRRTLRRVLEG